MRSCSEQGSSLSVPVRPFTAAPSQVPRLLWPLLTSARSHRGLHHHALRPPVVSLPVSLALGGSPLVRLDQVNQWSGRYIDDPAPQRHDGQISPDKDMNFQRTTAAFTLTPAPGGLRHLLLTRPGPDPSRRFLFVASRVCPSASFRHPLAGLPLPSASSYAEESPLPEDAVKARPKPHRAARG